MSTQVCGAKQHSVLSTQGAVEPTGTWQSKDRVLPRPTSLCGARSSAVRSAVTCRSAWKRQTSPALRRNTPWGRRSRAPSGGHHRGRARSAEASMAWALRAWRLRRASPSLSEPPESGGVCDVGSRANLRAARSPTPLNPAGFEPRIPRVPDSGPIVPCVSFPRLTCELA